MKSTALLTLLLVPAVGHARSLDTARLPIVSGQPATLDQVMSTVAIVDPQTGAPFCTGTLVSPGVVVTAAHCMVEQDQQTDEVLGVYGPERLEVVVGALDPTQASPDQRYEVEAVIPHGTYPKPGSGLDDPVGLGEQNDIGILITSQDVEGMAPTPILPADRVDEVLKAGTKIIITGYGINDLQTEEGGVLHIAETDFQRHNGKEYFAAGATDSCSGDSGGPGYVVVGGQRYLVGASARGNEAAEVKCGEGGINTLVPAYIGWIAQQASDLWDPPVANETGTGGGTNTGGTNNGGTNGGGTNGGGTNTGGTSSADDAAAETDDSGCTAGGRPGSPWGAALVFLSMLAALRLRWGWRS